MVRTLCLFDAALRLYIFGDLSLDNFRSQPSRHSCNYSPTPRVAHINNIVAYHTHSNRCYKFTDSHNFDREVVAIALNFYDRYLFRQTEYNFLSRDLCQLIAVTSLYLAIKIHGIAEDVPVEHRARHTAWILNNLCFGIFEGERVAEMESNILQVLDWRVNPPTMHSMATTLANLLPMREEFEQARTYIIEATRYQLEVVIFDPAVLEDYKPMAITFAAFNNSAENAESLIPSQAVKDFRLHLAQISSLIGVNREDVEDLQEHLEVMVPELPSIESVQRQCLGKSNPQEESDGNFRMGSNSPTNVMDLSS